MPTPQIQSVQTPACNEAPSAAAATIGITTSSVELASDAPAANGQKTRFFTDLNEMSTSGLASPKAGSSEQQTKPPVAEAPSPDVESHLSIMDSHELGKGGGAHHGHGHHVATGWLAPDRLGGVAAGAVCFLLYFFFCIVFSAVAFGELPQESPFAVSDGVAVVLLGIAIGCLSFAYGSGCKAIISGPDLLPVIFGQELLKAVKVYCDTLDDGAYKVLPTTLIAIIIGNVMTGLLFFGLGRAEKTSAAIGFIPASVISGFLSCIGYKVVKLAVFISTTHDLKFVYLEYLVKDYEDRVDPWVPLLIAFIIGVPLYFAKRRHVMRTDLLIFSFIIVPVHTASSNAPSTAPAARTSLRTSLISRLPF